MHTYTYTHSLPHTSPAPPPIVTDTCGRRVLDSAAKAAALSAPSTPPPSFSTSASTYRSHTALPGMMDSERRSRPPPPAGEGMSHARLNKLHSL
eukprot:1159863-Pelagomonas_calceolata.AAC.5